MHKIGPLLLFLAIFYLPQPVKAADNEHFLRLDGQLRRYIVHIPPSYRKKTSLPVILMFHGGGGSSEGQIRQTGMNKTADKYGFIAVYPEGIGSRIGNMHTWNAGRCCGRAASKNIDDVGFISALIDEMEQNYFIDSKRVYATGHSNGAQMSYRLACELSDKIAAIAPNAAQGVIENCNPSRGVPILHFHGTEDKCALYDGGESCGGCFSDLFHKMGLPMKENGWACDSVPQVMSEWAVRNQCKSGPVTYFQKGDVTCESWSNCRDGVEVNLCRIEGGGHSWPGGEYGSKACDKRPNGKFCSDYVAAVGLINNDISANEMMWDFFSRYKLP